ncbi:hypothetical protein FOMPIDRAFT_1024848 [Fomitopsis schrenkii]|uniref:Uncharacterized protein n=1 Tax=Fomitopsis schrenkii TaxID=2126942 RepID=S8DZD7_FOMSC|nr:hypothetical protein FOMPIDRAFT_1024848 [Fomitopsis schrenkii]
MNDNTPPGAFKFGVFGRGRAHALLKRRSIEFSPRYARSAQVLVLMMHRLQTAPAYKRVPSRQYGCPASPQRSHRV